jgi:hypothetical protein
MLGDSISEFRRSGLEGVKNLHIEIMKLQNGEIVNYEMVSSRRDLDRRFIKIMDH